MKIVTLGKVDTIKFLEGFRDRKPLHKLPNGLWIQVLSLRNYAFVYDKKADTIVVSDNMSTLMKHLEIDDENQR